LLTKLLAGALLALPLLSIGAIATAAEDSDHMIPPTKVGKLIDPHGQEPIDFSKVQVTTLTPADRFVNATTPLVIAMGLGSMALVIYTLAQGQKEIDGE
jgi:hypothetical protein